MVEDYESRRIRMPPGFYINSQNDAYASGATRLGSPLIWHAPSLLLAAKRLGLR
jgi:hypothetical protein